MHMEMSGPLGAQNLAFAALGGLAIAAGDSSRNRRAYLAEVERRATLAEAESEREARHRVAQERLRIARDLHDSVGHHLALISVQSDVAGRALDRDPGAAREALSHVKSASRTALAELGDTVGLLRQPGDPVAPTEVPAPGLAALTELLAGLRASGLTIDFQVAGTMPLLAPAVDLTAYRVIQEALTNVCKHSAQRQARLTIGYDRDELRITVDDLGALCPRARPCDRPPCRQGRLALRPAAGSTASPACASGCSPSAGGSPPARARTAASGSPPCSPARGRSGDHPRRRRR
jgi:signal transduction histidine kinase